MITTEYTEKINSFDDDWQDIKTGSPVINIRVKGTYPKQKVKHHHHVAHPHLGFLPCFNQHKPYGLATVHIQFHDDRPDWYRFHAEKKKRYFEEITCSDKEEFATAIEQDHDMNLPHNHVHIKQIEPDTKGEEIENDVVI